MRTILKHFIVETIALYIISTWVSGVVFENGMITLILAGLALMLSTMVVKPVINLLLLPLNLVTFGLFKWLSSAISIYLVTLVVPGFKLVEFYFKGMDTYWLNIPSIHFTGLISLIAFSFLISFVSSIIYWVFK